MALAGWTVTAPACDSYSKEQEREMQSVRDAISANPSAVNTLNARREAPLHLAVSSSYVPLIEWLHDRGAQVDVHGPYGDTPLHIAVGSDQTRDHRIIRTLLSMGADVNAANEYGDTPLHRAATHGDTEVVRLLLAHRADVTRRARRGETPLLYAARPTGHPDTAIALLEGGADANAPDAIGMTPLHGAAMIGAVAVARALIERGKAEVNLRTVDGYTALHVAAEAGHADFVRFLLTQGADRTLRDRHGLTAAERAQQFPAIRSTNSGMGHVDTSAAVEALQSP